MANSIRNGFLADADEAMHCTGREGDLLVLNSYV
jgi:hypothetical protein